MRKIFLTFLILLFPISLSAGILGVIAAKRTTTGSSEITLGKTDIGGSTSASSTSRLTSTLTVPVGGMTVTHGYFYGTMAVGEYVKLSIWSGGVQVGDCSTNVQGDGTTKWYEVTWGTPVELTGGQEVLLSYHPNGGGSNIATIDYYYDDTCSGCVYESGSSFNCNSLPNDTASTRDASFFVSNYDAH